MTPVSVCTVSKADAEIRTSVQVFCLGKDLRKQEEYDRDGGKVNIRNGILSKSSLRTGTHST